MHKKKVLTVAVLVLVAVILVVIPSSAQTSVDLSGTVNYYTYALKPQEDGRDPLLQDTTFPATAKLHYLDGKAIELVLTEHRSGVPLVVTLEGRLTPGGQLKLWYPEPLFPGTDITILDAFTGHTGCEMLGGTFPVHHGYMDGERLVTRMVFVTRCDQAWTANDIFVTPVDGVVDWEWSFDLTVG